MSANMSTKIILSVIGLLAVFGLTFGLLFLLKPGEMEDLILSNQLVRLILGENSENN